ncbi:unnamed protein product [Cylicostephanus goldi]|uniref:G-protein coupled receptors family 1 profile domain-containing protein n=1 Tax=Cylicostephanus goldi TaxID=71465 RepID=A0A3P7NS53_CYLGO|nr:unnamed protein product [Cylicostephanus goldi]
MGKLGMALTSVMSLSFVLGILATSLPKSERLPKIVIYVMANLLIVVFALVAALALLYLKEMCLHSCEDNKSDERKSNENKRYRKAAYVVIAMFELANLINLIVLIA